MRQRWLNSNSQNLERLQLSRISYGGLHSTIRCTLLSSRFMGLFPLSGLSHLHSDQLKFTLRSPYAIFYTISMFGQFLMCFVSVYWFLEKKISLAHLNAIFYASSFTSSLILVNVGRRWPKIIVKVEEIEAHLPPFSRDVGRICNFIMVSMLFAALVEHLLSVYYGVIVARACVPDNVIETFFRTATPWIYEYTTYSPWKAIFLKSFNIQSTFIWTFNDILIMVISIYLTEHFIIHNNLLKSAVLQDHFSAATFRVQYINIVRLIKLINGNIGIYILTSFGSNLYWICNQLFYSLKFGLIGLFIMISRYYVLMEALFKFIENVPLLKVNNFISKGFTGQFIVCEEQNSKYTEVLYGTEHAVYFIYSCAFLVGRTLMVLLLAARIHTHSNVPLVTLYGLSSEMFNIEVERYIAQINNIKVALSGLDFFYVTRTMILTLLGTIVTYELVLLQFSK